MARATREVGQSRVDEAEVLFRETARTKELRQQLKQDVEDARVRLKDEAHIPRCPKCSALARPNVSHMTDEQHHIVQFRI